MRNFHNIDKSVFSHADYIGYAHGPWRIRKAGGGWYVQPAPNCAYLYHVSAFNCDTLSEVSGKLDALAHGPRPGAVA